MEKLKEYRVVLTCTTRQVKIVYAISEEDASIIASEDDWREKEEVIDSSVDVYLNSLGEIEEQA